MNWRDERGFALIAVLWVVAALTLIAALFLHSGRAQVDLTRNLRENAKAEALADAAVQRALYGLLAAGTETGWMANGVSHDVTLPGGSASVIMYDEGGKIDLNRAREDILTGLLLATGVPADEVTSLADAIADFRDVDGDRREHGAEAAEYDHAGLLSGPKNGLFVRNDELRGVMGMTDDIYARLEPWITVYSSRRSVELASASETVLRALPYVTEQQRQQLLADRANGSLGSSSAALTVMIVADATTDDGGRFIREAVVRRSSDPQKIFDVLSWRHRWPTADSDGGS